jgi:hypothetical protein
MPKLHFGSRGGVYTIKKGTKKYLKFGNYEIDSNDFNPDDFGDAFEYDEDPRFKYHLNNKQKLSKLIDDINNGNKYQKNVIELFTMLGYSQPGGDKFPTNYYESYIKPYNLSDELEKLIGYDTDFDYYWGSINSIIGDLPQTIINNNPRRLF